MDSLEHNSHNHTPAEHARTAWQTSGPTRGRAVTYILVGLISLGIGVGATWFMLRPKATPPSAQGGAVPIATSGSQHAGHGSAEPPVDADTAEGASKAVYISPARQQLIGVRT